MDDEKKPLQLKNILSDTAVSKWFWLLVIALKQPSWLTGCERVCASVCMCSYVCVCVCACVWCVCACV